MPSQRELAAVISSHREGVSREMKNLERDGLIAKQGERLKILDLAALQESAGEEY